VVGSVPDDKGIESLTYAASTGYFYAGIQETATVHVLELADASDTTTGTTSDTTSIELADASATTTGATSDTTSTAAFHGKYVLLAPMIIFLRVML